MPARTAKLIFVVFASTVLFAQTQTPAPRPQTAREALIEMITGGEKGLMKHLTVEVQDLLNKPENKQSKSGVMMLNGMQRQAARIYRPFRLVPRFLPSTSLHNTRSLRSTLTVTI